MCNTILSSLVGKHGAPTNKKVTIKPGNSHGFQGKILSVNREINFAIVTERETGIKKSVSLSTHAKSGW